MSHDQKNRTLGIAEHRAMQLEIFKVARRRIENAGWISTTGKLKPAKKEAVLEYFVGVADASSILSITPALVTTGMLFALSFADDLLSAIRMNIAWLESWHFHDPAINGGVAA